LSFTDGRIHELLVDSDWKVLYAVELSNGFGEGAMVYLARLCTKVFAGPLRLRRLDVRRGSASPLRLPLTLRLRRPDVRRGSASP